MSRQPCKVSLVSMLLIAMCIFFSSSAIATPEPSSGLLTDNWDGYLPMRFARLALQHAVGKVALPQDDILRLDQNGDGTLSTSDARMLLQKVVGKWTPTPLTETVNTLPEGQAVDFHVLGQTRIWASAQTDTNGLYLAKSYTDLKAIFSQLYDGCPTPDLDDAYTGIDFADHAVLVLHCVDGSGNTIQRVDSLLRVDGQLIVCSTAVHATHPTPDMGNRYVVMEIELHQLEGVQSLTCYSEQQAAEQ